MRHIEDEVTFAGKRGVLESLKEESGGGWEVWEVWHVRARETATTLPIRLEAWMAGPLDLRFLLLRRESHSLLGIDQVWPQSEFPLVSCPNRVRPFLLLRLLRRVATGLPGPSASRKPHLTRIHSLRLRYRRNIDQVSIVQDPP